MKGVIEYLRAIREICKNEKLTCKECPLKVASEYLVGCPMEVKPACLSDEDILFMVQAPERVKNGRV